jgi:hypothetical protein
MLYDVSALDFETDTGDAFRETGSPGNAAWSG